MTDSLESPPTKSELRFEVNPTARPSTADIFTLFRDSGISHSAWSDDRMRRALDHSAIVVYALRGDELIGFARVLSDTAWIAYLSQLAVTPSFQKQGIGRELIRQVRSHLGDEVALLVHSADSATGFYESLGFELRTNIYRLPRAH